MRLLLHCLMMLWVLGALAACDSETVDDPTVSGMYEPCGVKDVVCAEGLSCLPSQADGSVFLCTRSCEPSPKCPGVIAVGECRALLECGQGCCEVNNTWTQSSVKVSCEETETTAVLSDGFCQPWP